MNNNEIKIEKLSETSLGWNGSKLPAYPAGQPVVTILKYTFPPHVKLPSHYHTIINCGVVLSGELTVVAQDGTEHTFRKGEPVVEMVGGIHYGENRGNEPVELIMFYAGTKDTPLSVKV